jgi:hypothetical protein
LHREHNKSGVDDVLRAGKGDPAAIEVVRIR